MVGAILFCSLATAGEIRCVVLDADGKPAADVAVEMRVGLARYALTKSYDEWLFLGSPHQGKTDQNGKVTFSNLPDGAVGAVLARAPDGAAFAQGSGDLELRLAPLGNIKGKISGGRSDLKGARVWVSSCHGLAGIEAKPDEKTGRFEVEGVPAGPARVYVKTFNFDLARYDVDVVPGKDVKLKSTRFSDKFVLGWEPLVDVMRVQFVNEKGEALAGINMWWSSRFMSGAMDSDGAGETKLAGGGVAIGGPPYVLHLSSIQRDKVPLFGELQKVKRGVAIVEIREIPKLKGTLKIAGKPVDHYRVVVIGPPDERIVHATVEAGQFEVYAPLGKCRIVVGTADGKLREKEIDVTNLEIPLHLEFAQ